MSDKIYLKVSGGLGNQMFQWAFARMLMETLGVRVLLDLSFFNKSYAKNRPYKLGVFNLKPSFVEDFGTKLKLSLVWKFRKSAPFLSKLLGINFCSEQGFKYEEKLKQLAPDTYLEGFFQSEKYFEEIEDKLREDFEFKDVPSEENLKIIEKMKSSNSVSVHIRRGDYVQKARYSNYYAHCSLDYYKNAVEYIAEKYPNPEIFFFSDDIDWVKENLKFPYPCFYVANNTGDKSFEDLRLMSCCKHNVIANSSFSWWGAWLNNNKDKVVVAPKKWLQDSSLSQDDIVPATWVRLDN